MAGRRSKLACMALIGGWSRKPRSAVGAWACPMTALTGGDDAARVAPRVVTGRAGGRRPAVKQQSAWAAMNNLRGSLPGEKAVDALLWVAHGRKSPLGWHPPPRARIAGQPRQNARHRSGLASWNPSTSRVANARIQALPAPSRTGRVGQHDQRRALHIACSCPPSRAAALTAVNCAIRQRASGPGAAGAARFVAGDAGHQQAQQLGQPLRGGELQVLRWRSPWRRTRLCAACPGVQVGQASASMMASGRLFGVLAPFGAQSAGPAVNAAGAASRKASAGSRPRGQAGENCLLERRHRRHRRRPRRRPALNSHALGQRSPPAPCAFAIGHGAPPRFQ